MQPNYSGTCNTTKSCTEYRQNICSVHLLVSYPIVHSQTTECDYYDYSCGYDTTYDNSEEYCDDYPYLPQCKDCTDYLEDFKIKKKVEAMKCSEFKDQGYSCVPFHVCQNGQINTSGTGIFTIRLQSLAPPVQNYFNPADAKCPDQMVKL